MPSVAFHVNWCKKLLDEYRFKDVNENLCVELNRFIDHGLKHDLFKGSIADLPIGYLTKAELKYVEDDIAREFMVNRILTLLLYQHHILDLLEFVATTIEDLGILGEYREYIVDEILRELQEEVKIDITGRERDLLRNFHLKHYSELVKQLLRRKRRKRKICTSIMREIIYWKLTAGKFSITRMNSISWFIRKTYSEYHGLTQEKLRILVERLLGSSIDINHPDNMNSPTSPNRDYRDTSTRYIKYQVILYQKPEYRGRYNRALASAIAADAYINYITDKHILEETYSKFTRCVNREIPYIKFILNAFLNSVRKYLLKHRRDAPYAITMRLVYFMFAVVTGSTIRIGRRCIEELVCLLNRCDKEQISEAINDAIWILEKIASENNNSR